MGLPLILQYLVLAYFTYIGVRWYFPELEYPKPELFSLVFAHIAISVWQF